MFAPCKHLFLALLAVSLVCGASAGALAQCATCGAQTVAYQPVAVQAFSPVTTTTYSSGWYPGYWLGRANRAIWGVPATTTTVGFAPTATFAAYQPAYAVGYAPVSSCPTCSTCSTCAASYAPVCPTCSTCSTCASYAPSCPTCSTCTASYAPTCSTCSTCAAPVTVSEVVLRPVCDTCSGCSTCSPCSSCSSCSGCSTCGAAPTVTQAVYDQPAPCASCGASQAAPVTTTAPSVYTTPAPAVTRATEPQPTLAPTPQSAPPQSTFRETQKVEPAPATDSAPILQPTPQKGPGEGNSTNLEAPRLLSPQDRTAQRNAAPVWMAVYNKPASGRTAVHTVSREQAIDDASGWISASK
jgi:hypothetical protein